jgi:pyruvate,water dikinase
MKYILPINEISRSDMGRVGGKAYALAMMKQKGLNVPRAVTITTEAYNSFVDATGLRENIMMEMNRKSDNDVRWEELWDTSLRIRNMFVNAPLPLDLHKLLTEAVETYFTGKSVVVRSSAPGEDSSETSFAGLHESYVNVRGIESIIEHIKLVWASLWSDASLLYRKELALDERKSSMAVVVQEIITGEVSGIGFGQNPNDSSQCVIEAVYGLNQGLVDGTLQPDRWILDRAGGELISHTPADRSQTIVPSDAGTELTTLPPELRNKAPLNDENVQNVYSLVMKSEQMFGLPQDVEWTMNNNAMYVLQSRPITTLSGEDKDDKRGWYLSLTKSFENLKSMRLTIEEELIPALQHESEDLAKTDLSQLSDQQIRDEAARRREIFAKWKKTYWDYFIPFAHGMRLFGTVYNDTVHPGDPYEFLSLLSKGNNMVSVQRNDILQEMASLVQDNDRLADDLKGGNDFDPSFRSLLEQFITSHGDLLCRSPH